jgi:hypothetical protein
LPSSTDKRLEFIQTGKFTLLDGKVELDFWPGRTELRRGIKNWVEKSALDGKAWKVYIFYLECFLAITVTETAFNRDKFLKPVSQIATISDQAVTRLFIDNAYHKWMVMADWE